MTVWNLCMAATLTTALAGCSGGPSANGSADGFNGAEGTTPRAPSVRTTEAPEDPCGWIPVAEVESAVGKLAAAPQPEGNGCRYTLAMSPDVSGARQKALDRMARLREQFNDPSLGRFSGPMANYQADPGTYAITLSVDISGSVSEELGAAAVFKRLQAELPMPGAGGDAEPDLPAGWDAVLSPPYAFSGRIGHVLITAQGQAPDVSTDLAKALADRVRERLPDLPFPSPSSYQVPTFDAEAGDPCGLLTRAEAEEVLGPLVVEPYRASSQHPALALDSGDGCAYYTAQHRVFSIVPSWSGGQETFGMEKGIGNLISSVVPQDLLVIKGPWEQAHVSPGTGALLFLQGDRLLEVHYRTSSADMRGAIRLAAKAIPRMTP